MSKHIRTFGSFQGKRRNIKGQETINETVIQRDSSFIVGGVKVDKKTINAYAKKVKDQTGKDLKSMYSEMEIAEELVKWSVNSLDNIDNVPVSALMGGEEEMAQDVDVDAIETDVDETGEMDDEVSVDDAELDTDGDDSLDLDMDDETAGDDDLDLDTGDDDFESPEEGDEDLDLDVDTEGDDLDLDTDEDEDDDLDLDTDEDEDEEDEDLPI